MRVANEEGSTGITTQLRTVAPSPAAITPAI
jgi:hypothetical protein